MGKKDIAKERIRTLFEEARTIHPSNHELANRYMEIAWDIALKLNVSFTKEQKIQFCRQCHSYLVPGKNARYRVGTCLKVTCQSCNAIRRYRIS